MYLIWKLLLCGVILTFTVVESSEGNNQTIRVNRDLDPYSDRSLPDKLVQIGEFPFVVSLRIITSQYVKVKKVVNPEQHFCSGAIITSTWIITAGHCLRHGYESPLEAEAVGVVAGEINVVPYANIIPAHKRKCLEIVTHEDWQRNLASTDIAMLRVDPWKFEKDGPIQKVPLSNQDIAENTQCLTAGWGGVNADDPQFPISNQMQYLNFSTIEFDTCKPIHPSIFLSDPLVCQDHVKDKKIACLADAGSPLVCNGQLSGIAVFVRSPRSDRRGPQNPRGCPSAVGDIYLRTHYYREWILDVLDGVNMAEYKRRMKGSGNKLGALSTTALASFVLVIYASWYI